MKKRTLTTLVVATFLITSCKLSTPHQGGLYPEAQFGSEAEMRYNQEQADTEEMQNIKNAESINADTRNAIDRAVKDMN